MAKKNLFLKAGSNVPTLIIDHALDYNLKFISKDPVELAKIRKEIELLLVEFNHVTDTSKKTDDVREMLQVVANRLINNVREDIWVHSMIKDMDITQDEMGFEKFVHDDLRYPFEYDALRAQGFVLIRLNISPVVQAQRIKELYGTIDPERLTHISETALDRALFDYTIDADQPLEDVLKEIDQIIGG